jgi:hypothetical protein
MFKAIKDTRCAQNKTLSDSLIITLYLCLVLFEHTLLFVFSD